MGGGFWLFGVLFCRVFCVVHTCCFLVFWFCRFIVYCYCYFSFELFEVVCFLFELVARVFGFAGDCF